MKYTWFNYLSEKAGTARDMDTQEQDFYNYY